MEEGEASHHPGQPREAVLENHRLKAETSDWQGSAGGLHHIHACSHMLLSVCIGVLDI